jgi:hypothetical protein
MIVATMIMMTWIAVNKSPRDDDKQHDSDSQSFQVDDPVMYRFGDGDWKAGKVTKILTLEDGRIAYNVRDCAVPTMTSTITADSSNIQVIRRQIPPLDHDDDDDKHDSEVAFAVGDKVLARVSATTAHHHATITAINNSSSPITYRVQWHNLGTFKAATISADNMLHVSGDDSHSENG